MDNMDKNKKTAFPKGDLKHEVYELARHCNQFTDCNDCDIRKACMSVECDITPATLYQMLDEIVMATHIYRLDNKYGKDKHEKTD